MRLLPTENYAVRHCVGLRERVGVQCTLPESGHILKRHKEAADALSVDEMYSTVKLPKAVVNVRYFISCHTCQEILTGPYFRWLVVTHVPNKLANGIPEFRQLPQQAPALCRLWRDHCLISYLLYMQASDLGTTDRDNNPQSLASRRHQ